MYLTGRPSHQAHPGTQSSGKVGLVRPKPQQIDTGREQRAGEEHQHGEQSFPSVWQRWAKGACLISHYSFVPIPRCHRLYEKFAAHVLQVPHIWMREDTRRPTQGSSSLGQSMPDPAHGGYQVVLARWDWGLWYRFAREMNFFSWLLVGRPKLSRRASLLS